MPKLHLDFTQRRYPRSPFAWVVLVGGVCTSIGVLSTYQRVHEQHLNLQAQQRRLESSAKSEKAALRTLEAAGPMAVALNRAQAQLHQPWYAIFGALAAATQASSVGLLTMDLESNMRTLRFSADAKDFKSAVQCIQALHDNSLIESVSLTGHEMRDDPSGARLRFQAELKYKAAR